MCAKIWRTVRPCVPVRVSKFSQISQNLTAFHKKAKIFGLFQRSKLKPKINLFRKKSKNKSKNKSENTVDFQNFWVLLGLIFDRYCHILIFSVIFETFQKFRSFFRTSFLVNILKQRPGMSKDRESRKAKIFWQTHCLNGQGQGQGQKYFIRTYRKYCIFKNWDFMLNRSKQPIISI